MSASDRLKTKLEKMKQSAAAKAAKVRKESRAIGVEAAGQAGGAVSAIAIGALDAKYAPSEGLTKFGKSDVAIAPVAGVTLMLLSLPLIKISPAGAAFVGRAGQFAADLGIYTYARSKAEEWMAED